MKIIDFESIRALNLPSAECYRLAEEMIRDKADAYLPAKIHMGMQGNAFCNVMPSIIHGSPSVGGVKVVTRYPERIPSLDSKILLFNADTGEFLALMDGNWITAMRTGAVAAHSVMTFAREGWRTIGLIGLGNVARSSLAVLASVTDKPLEVRLLRYKDQAEAFIERFRHFPNLEFRIVGSAEDCIRDTDVILSCATYFENDIAQDEWFSEGTLVVPVHTRGFSNCDLFFDKVFADDTKHVENFRYFSRFRSFAEVSDVITGKAKGRENNTERILVYNIGVSIHDIHYAFHIYQKMQENPAVFRGLADADMHDPTEKHWF